MIIKFQQYEQLNEGWKNDLLSLSIMSISLFNQIGGDVPRRYNMEYLQKYFQSFNVATTDNLVKEAIKDFKMKIMNDPKILNKQEVIATIDSTPILFRKNDEICNLLYRKFDDNLGVSSWCSTIVSKNQKDKKGGKSYIFLNPKATYGEIIHELSHATESVINIDPKILDLFDFNKSILDQRKLFILMTNYEYESKSQYLPDYIKYLNNPSEIYSRLNSLKFFLYKNKIINSPNDDINNKIIFDILMGFVFKNLDENNKQIFMDSDFIDILRFINTKKNPDLDKYVNNISKQKKIGYNG